MTNPKVVTEEQVEAAAKALAQKEPGSEWDDFDEREFFLRRARQALEAAFSADERHDAEERKRIPTVTNYNVELYIRDDEYSEMEQVPFEVFQFPGGELQLRDITLPADAWEAVIYMRGADPYSIVTVNLLTELLISFRELDYFTLAVPYMPAARSDRGTLSALPSYLGALTRLQPALSNRLHVLDIHNEEALRDKFSEYYIQYSTVDDAVFRTDRIMESHYGGVIAPDRGARRRAAAIAEELEVPLCTATKDRDFETGKLLKFNAPNGLHPDCRYLVVDDICDGGGTFAGLVKAISEAYPGNHMVFDLWVTHGVFSGNWEGNLMDSFDNVYTTNSHPNTDNINHPRVHVTDMRPFMIGE